MVEVVAKVVECLVAKLHVHNGHRHIYIVDHRVLVVLNYRYQRANVFNTESVLLILNLAMGMVMVEI